ncbi:MAG: bifunctional metallophosphatase/5'-nucleotidase [Verrucomicrobiae bacterium]|nr:bifunctional metallophosphatase/5'-nucleotidase [Verrucomicrobiae bacterium]
MGSSLNRRHFLRSSTAAGIGLLAAPPGGQADDLVTVSIFYTTDLHGHILPTESYTGWKNVGGLARCATQIQRWRSENPNSLLIDVGDVYQGTHVSKQSDGALMVSLLNKLNYDAWVIGNHEFDWGLEALAKAVDSSDMPVLSSNALLGSRAAWDAPASDTSPLNKIRPYVLREIAGFKIAIIGATTPGLPAWLHPKLLQNFSASEPAMATRNAAAAARADGAHCVIIAGHMGLKNKTDDYANPVRAITDAVEADAFIAGHTHQDMASISLNRTLYTQANYYGIHAGRLDLTFSRSASKLVQKRAFTVLMDSRFDLDPVVIDHSRKELDNSATALATKVGSLKNAMTTDQPARTEPSLMHRLIGSGIRHALAQKDVKIDAIFHGTFSDKGLAAGVVTLADLWTVIPYENMLVTAELSTSEIAEIIEEDKHVSFSNRILMGLPSRPDPDQRWSVAFNAYDAQSGGRRLNRLKEILESPAARTQFHKVESREALIVYLQNVDNLSIDQLLI